MFGSLRELLELPNRSISAESAASGQPNNFRQRFRELLNELNDGLVLSSTLGKKAARAELAVKRDTVCAAYQTALEQIDVIEPEELERVLTATSALATRSAGFAERGITDKNRWADVEPQFDASVEHVAALEDENHPKAAALRNLCDAVRARVNKHEFKEATTLFEQIKSKLETIINGSSEKPLGEAGEIKDPDRDHLLEFTLRIVIDNKTSFPLKLGPDEVEDRYRVPPPKIAPARRSTAFVVAAKKKAVGSMTWISTAGEDEMWNIHYEHTPPGEYETQISHAVADLPNLSRFMSEVDQSQEDNGELRFILRENEPPPKTFVSRITLVNDTDLELRKEKDSDLLSAGVYETAPPPIIPRRQTLDFEVRSQGTQAPNDQQFVSGVVTYTPVGNEPERWNLSFGAATGLATKGDSDVKSDRLITDKPRIDGTNFRFNLRGKGSPPPPGPNSFVSKIFIKNSTKLVLQRRGYLLEAGVYEEAPLEKIQPGELIEFTVRSKPTSEAENAAEIVSGRVEWLPDGATNDEIWTIQYKESPRDTRLIKLSECLSKRFIADKPPNNFEFTLRDAPPSPTSFVSRVVVMNNTNVTLLIKDPKPIDGTFEQPPKDIPPGLPGEIIMRSDGADFGERVSASLVWEPQGFPSGERWSMTFSKIAGDLNGTAQQQVDSIRFEAEETLPFGNDFRFVLNPVAEPEFKKPEPTRQPTLRFDDRGVDGWVEYLQEQLNALVEPSPKLVVDGHFGQATYDAVYKFQGQAGIQQDWVVGNETWAALRHGPKEEPSTDGRKPHTYVEEGLEARWLTEDEAATFDQSKDELVLVCVSVGDEAQLVGQNVNVFVTPPGGKRKGFVAKIGGKVSTTTSSQGETFGITLKDFRKSFPSTPETAPIQDYLVEAYFDEELGSDFYTSSKGGFKTIS